MRPSFTSVPIKECGEQLVELSQEGFSLQPEYYLQQLTHEKRMFLRESVVKKLLAIQDELKIVRFKIWDGYRPRQLQRKLYERLWKKLEEKHPEWNETALENEVRKFVNPWTEDVAPPHATGGAIDLTLVSTDGTELDMGTAFDHFGPEAASLYFDKNKINETVKENRKMLRKGMQSEGFWPHAYEWWHFEYGTQSWALGYNKPYAMYGVAKTKPTEDQFSLQG